MIDTLSLILSVFLFWHFLNCLVSLDVAWGQYANSKILFEHLGYTYIAVNFIQIWVKYLYE